MSEIINHILFLGLGAVVTLLFQYLSRRIKRREERIEALTLLETVTEDATHDVGHDVGHEERFKHKDAWATEIGEFATAYRKELPDLYISLKKIAWQIESSSFSHKQKDSIEYCCNELLNDLMSIQLNILQEIRGNSDKKGAWTKRKIDSRAKCLVGKMLVNLHGLGLMQPKGQSDPRIAEYIKRWENGEEVTNELRGDRPIGRPWEKADELKTQH
jgi:hypothetical protein